MNRPRDSFKSNAMWHSSMDDVEAWNSEWHNVSQDRHSHDFFQISVTLRGNGRVECGGRSVECPVDHCLIIPPEEVHELRPRSELPWQFETLYLPINRVTAILSGWDTPPRRTCFTRDPIRDGALNRRFRRLHAAVICQTEPLAQDELLVAFLERIGRYRGDNPTASRLLSHDAGLDRVCNYLDGHLDRSISLRKLAELAGMGAYHLLRLFRQRYGLPPYAYHLQARIRRARTLLKQGRSPAVVAVDTGFADQSHLTRHFKRLVGVTPGDFRPKSITFKTR